MKRNVGSGVQYSFSGVGIFKFKVSFNVSFTDKFLAISLIVFLTAAQCSNCVSTFSVLAIDKCDKTFIQKGQNIRWPKKVV